MKLSLICAALLGLAAGPALAQTALTIAATGQASAVPDQAVASLTIQADAPDAATAQANVNKTMATALAEAHNLSGLIATTGGYNSYSSQPDSSKPPQFTAQQQLTLIQPAQGGIPSAAVTALLGQLQRQGLLLNSLSGGLSAAGQNQANAAAIADALTQIQAQAASIAAQLHEHTGRIQTLNVNAASSPGPQPVMMAMAVRAAAPPQSAPDNITTSANVTAEIDLTP